MSELNLFTGPGSSNDPSTPPPRRSFRTRIAVGVACGVIGLGIVGTTAAFAAQGGEPTPMPTSSISPTPGSTDVPAPVAPDDGATPPTPPAPGAAGVCAPGAPGAPGAPADGAVPTAPPAPADGTAPPAPADGGAAPTPPSDTPAPPTEAPAPAPTGTAPAS
ncbi:hypothetical protein ASF06_02090 [Agreia sp. Leaf244]|uniref:hypothetical protein n=1 Tax=Agreia sp. Leaf244 TaxID=1736305 RepID=UPI0006FC6D01|nr:hypothetical protein [Agreia sp. Leaf244]KQO11467.1 hypothetical protein ASF06_02090 [Agreia sp. Leaf244]